MSTESLTTGRRLITALLYSDRFLDRVLDHLTERSAHDDLGLARWDLKAALRDTIEELNP